MIPDEAVEAAARALCEADTDGGLIHPIAAYMDHARLALEAAAPHMLAKAWDEGRAAGWDDCLVDWQASVEQVTPNPYRTAK